MQSMVLMLGCEHTFSSGRLVGVRVRKSPPTTCSRETSVAGLPTSAHRWMCAGSVSAVPVWAGVQKLSLLASSVHVPEAPADVTWASAGSWGFPGWDWLSRLPAHE